MPSDPMSPQMDIYGMGRKSSHALVNCTYRMRLYYIPTERTCTLELQTISYPFMAWFDVSYESSSLSQSSLPAEFMYSRLPLRDLLATRKNGHTTTNLTKRNWKKQNGEGYNYGFGFPLNDYLINLNSEHVENKHADDQRTHSITDWNGSNYWFISGSTFSNSRSVSEL